MATRVIVPGSFPDHEAVVKAAISFGYGSDISGDILVISGDLGTAFTQALATGAVAAVYSYAGLPSYVTNALTYYPGILGFMPLGLNSFIELATPASIPVIVTAGAGDTQNDTAYGAGLEFWDDDNDGNPNTDASSFSNGTICGRLLKIKDTLNCGWWEARYRARMTASNNGVWDKFNGFGKINMANAVAFSGPISGDPYLPQPVLPSVIPFERKDVPLMDARTNRQLETIFQTFYSSARGVDASMRLTMQDVLQIPTGSLDPVNGIFYVSPLFVTNTAKRQYNTIQAAVDATPTNGTGSIVLVYPGAYSENITLKAGVQLTGLDANSVVLTPAAGTAAITIAVANTASQGVQWNGGVSNLRIEPTTGIPGGIDLSVKTASGGKGAKLFFNNLQIVTKPPAFSYKDLDASAPASKETIIIDSCYMEGTTGATGSVLVIDGTPVGNNSQILVTNTRFRTVSTSGSIAFHNTVNALSPTAEIVNCIFEAGNAGTLGNINSIPDIRFRYCNMAAPFVFLGGPFITAGSFLFDYCNFAVAAVRFATNTVNPSHTVVIRNSTCGTTTLTNAGLIQFQSGARADNSIFRVFNTTVTGGRVFDGLSLNVTASVAFVDVTNPSNLVSIGATNGIRTPAPLTVFLGNYTSDVDVDPAVTLATGSFNVYLNMPINLF